MSLLTKHALFEAMMQARISYYWARRNQAGKEGQLERVRCIQEYRKLRANYHNGHYTNEMNDRGNIVYRDYEADTRLGMEFSARYGYDDKLGQNGWKAFDTKQDASYFGMWVDVENRRTFTYCEGDRILVECPTLESFRAELQDAERFYGECPPAFIVFMRDGSKINVFDSRPSV